MSIRVLLADDQALLAGTFRILIDASDGMEVVGVAEDGDQAVGLARTTAPDIVVMDIRMPGKDGLDAAEEILRSEAPHRPRILVLTTFETDEYVTRALRAGVSGFLGKGIAPAEFLGAIRTVAAGDMILSPPRHAHRHQPLPRRPGPVGRGTRGARNTHTPRTRGPGTGGQRAHQSRDRRAPVPEPADRTNLHPAHHGQARRPSPRPTRGDRLPVRLRTRPPTALARRAAVIRPRRRRPTGHRDHVRTARSPSRSSRSPNSKCAVKSVPVSTGRVAARWG